LLPDRSSRLAGMAVCERPCYRYLDARIMPTRKFRELATEIEGRVKKIDRHARPSATAVPGYVG